MTKYQGTSFTPQRTKNGYALFRAGIRARQPTPSQLPPQHRVQPPGRVAVPPARDPRDLHQISAQRVVRGKHPAHVELVLHGACPPSDG